MIAVVEEDGHDNTKPDDDQTGYSTTRMIFETPIESTFSPEGACPPECESISQDISTTVTSSTANSRQSELSPDLEDAVRDEDADDSKVMRCERCHAEFSSLHQFMDHRNFECQSGTGLSPADDE
ncbi:hypothetical protein ElyMa_003765000 [Elysia marginata]|uniref:C2H2-type domain-containing protein n=1 Tax=Elysia marginata TaxID=1093978 RepID=A0AAV4F947_9GAST|nr:hypothetical protein ElyMa_003765000 [Elysia marginata]